MKVVIIIAILIMITVMTFGCTDKKNNFADEQEETVIVTIPEGEPIIMEEYITEAPTEPTIVCGTVNTDRLNVRKEPYIDARVYRQLSIGSRVEILERKILDGIPWGRIEVGWINLEYIDLE